MLLGLVRPNAGTAASAAGATSELEHPSSTSARCSRTRASTPAAAAATTCACSPPPAAMPAARVDEVLERGGARPPPPTGASRATRWACASAWPWPPPCSGTPQMLILDEPANGLDPPGIRWMRDFLRSEARRADARVLVSSHLLAEVAQSADDLVVIAARAAARRRSRSSRCSGCPARPPPACARPTPSGSRALRASRDAVETGSDGALVVHGLTPGRGRAAGRSSTAWRSRSSAPWRARWRTPSSSSPEAAA